MPDIELLAKQAKAMLKTDKPEPKDAGSDSSSEKAKTEGEAKSKEVDEAKVIADAETKAKQDEEILSKKDEELKDDEKTRKAEMLKVKDAEDKKAEKSNVQKRFDELTAKIKDLEGDRDATKAEKAELADELTAIKKQLSLTPEDKSKEKIKSEMQSRNKKYVEEDKELPKEDKREMAKEELDEWLLEDYEGASEWLTRRSIRRIQEENHLRQDDINDKRSVEILEKQNKSAEKTYVKHPELNISKRMQELITQGKSKEDIFKILCDEVPKYKIASEIVKENPEKYMLAENGPELIVAELDKRLNSKKEVNEDSENIKKELAAVKAENERLKGLDVGITSTRRAEPQGTLTELDKKREELALKVGLSPDRMKAAVKRRADKGYDG